MALIKNILLKLVVALLLTIAIVFFLDKTFVKFHGRMSPSSMHGKVIQDIDGDGTTEFCPKMTIKKEGLYFEYWTNDFLKKIWRDSLRYCRQPALVTDIDKDGVVEDYFLTISNSETFLNTLVYNNTGEDSTFALSHSKKKLFESTIDNETNVFASDHKDLNNDGFDELIFAFVNGTERRQIIVYDVMNDELKFSKLNCMFITELNFSDIDGDGFTDILFSTYANGNIPEKSIDSYAEFYGNQQEYYTDCNAYVGALDYDLNLKFIASKEGFTSMYHPTVVEENGEKYILAIESQLSDSTQIPSLVKFNHKGDEVLRQKMPFKVPSNTFGKFTKNLIIESDIKGKQRVYLNGVCDSIVEVDFDLNIVDYFYRDGVSRDSRLKRFDLDGDGIEEIIINTEGGFLIYQDGFEDELFLPTKSAKGFRIYNLTEQEKELGVYVNLGHKKGFYLVYEKNEFFYWKYLLYVAILILIYLVIHGIQKYGARQLEKDKKQLEKVVGERTAELSEKNKDLNIVLDKVGQQKLILEKKNKEITDSIKYAKRIQTAILPPQKLVKEYLQDSFILYKPKDIVAGDFYWMEHKDGKVLFAAADCTGHGVPGAMVSVVCNNGLNRSVREYGLTDPGQILDKTRELVIKEFEKSEEDVKDGMDIALCSLEGMVLEYAGAYNPLWIIRAGAIMETKANKQPIGKFDNPQSYVTHRVDLQENDTIYIFSDGLVDQFGGEKGKKFKPNAFRKLLLSIQNETMSTQRQVIDNAFEEWRGDIEQIDDICIIGVRV